jgi:hypothetical protein
VSLWLGVPAQLTDTFTVSDFRVREKEHAKHLVNEEAIAGRSGGWGGGGRGELMQCHGSYLRFLVSLLETNMEETRIHSTSHYNLLRHRHLAVDKSYTIGF